MRKGIVPHVVYQSGQWDQGSLFSRNTLELAAIAEECAGWAQPRVRVDDSALDALLRPRFVERGWTVGGNVMLAWVGDTPQVEAVRDVDVDIEPDLEEWSVAKLRGFSEDDDKPSAQRVQRERSLREAEDSADMARLRLARVEGEPVAVIGWYDDGGDIDIFNLATRLAWRRRGVARTRRWRSRSGRRRTWRRSGRSARSVRRTSRVCVAEWRDSLPRFPPIIQGHV